MAKREVMVSIMRREGEAVERGREERKVRRARRWGRVGVKW